MIDSVGSDAIKEPSVAPETPRVSVLMPVLDAGAFLQPALESLSAQSLTGIEVIAVDDGSTDGSRELLERHARSDPRFRVLTQQRRGGAAARNRAAGEAVADLLALADADDVSLPDRLERQVTFLDAHPDVSVLGGAVETIDDEGRPHGVIRLPTDPDEIEAHLLARGSCLNDPTVMMRRAAFERAGGYRETLATAYDYDLWLRMLPAERFANLGEVLVRYRRHPGQTTHQRAVLTAFTAIVVRAACRQRQRTGQDPLEGWDGTIDLDLPARVGLSGFEATDLYARMLYAARRAGGDRGFDRGRIEASVLAADLADRPPDADLAPLVSVLVRLLGRSPVRAGAALARLAVTAPGPVGRAVADKLVRTLRRAAPG